MLPQGGSDKRITRFTIRGENHQKVSIIPKLGMGYAGRRHYLPFLIAADQAFDLNFQPILTLPVGKRGSVLKNGFVERFDPPDNGHVSASELQIFRLRRGAPPQQERGDEWDS